MKPNPFVYFDNAATSWPKPPEVARAMTFFLSESGANPGHSGHRLSVQAARTVYRAREAVAEIFKAPDPMRVVFGINVTEALNLALHGLLHPGDHVVTTSMEHNSMIRPLRALEKEGVQVTIVSCSPEGVLDPEEIEKAIRPNTLLIALNHASNVVGTLLPVARVGEIARRHDILLLSDEAQTGGAYPIDMEAEAIDLLAFTGHKSLYGPMGTGGLIIGKRVNTDRLRPLKQGGTGSHSEFETQPSFLPDLYESGTLNGVGIAGLDAGIRWVLQRGVEEIRAHEMGLLRKLLEGLQEIDGVRVYGCGDMSRMISTVSFNIDGLSPAEVGLRMDEDFGIRCRIGLHCAPLAHKTIGTFPVGTVRFSPGAFSTMEEVDQALLAVRRLAKERTSGKRPNLDRTIARDERTP